MRPARWDIWLSYQNVCPRSETKGFCNSLIQHMSHVHGSLLLSIPHAFFCYCRFIIVISWNMPLFKVWREDKLNKKFVVAENLAKPISKGKQFCFYSFISWVHGMTGWGIWPSLKLEWVGHLTVKTGNIARNLTKIFQKVKCPGVCPRGGGGGNGWFWNWPVHKSQCSTVHAMLWACSFLTSRTLEFCDLWSKIDHAKITM